MKNPFASFVTANRKLLVMSGILLCMAALGFAALEPWPHIARFFAGEGNSSSSGPKEAPRFEIRADEPAITLAPALAEGGGAPPSTAAAEPPSGGLFTTTKLNQNDTFVGLFDDDSIAALPEIRGSQTVSRKIVIPKQGKKYRTAVGATAPSDDVEGGLLYEFEMTKDPATGRIPEGVREAERKQADEIVELQRQLDLPELASYSFVGPNNLGGRTRSIAYDVRYNGTSNQIILACGVSGGVYKSTDDGANWVRRSSTGDHFSCTSLAQDPRAGFQDTWYYSVGESLGNTAGAANAFYSGNGVYKSIDNGNTWTRLSASNTSALESFDSNADLINKVVVDPTNGNVYAAAVGAILRSTDGGASWNSVLAAAFSSSNQDTDIVVTSSGGFYAAFAGFNPSGVDGVWTSATGAVGSWTRIAGAGNGGSPTGWNGDTNQYGRVVLAVAPSSENILYALYYSSVDSACPTVALPGNIAAPEAELFRYDQTLNAWLDLSANMPDETGCSDGNDPFAVQRGYDLAVAVKPDDPSTIFIGGTNIYRSTNIGSTWTRIGGYNSAANYAVYANSHADIHSIAFAPTNPNIMLCGNDGGIQRTTNVLASTVAWNPINTGYRTYQYYYVVNDPRSGNNKVIGGAQDNGTTRNVGGSGSIFEQVLGGDGVAVGLSDPAASGGTQFEYVGTQEGKIRRRASTDPLGNAATITPTGAGQGLFVTLFKLDPDNTQTLYYANDETLYRTTSASTVTSTTWTNMTGIAAAVGAANDITAIGLTRAAYNPATSSLFFGTSDGRVFRLDNPTGVAPATAPVNITGGSFPPAGYVSSIAVSPLNDDVVLVTFSNYGVSSIWYTGNANSPAPDWLAVEGDLTLPSVRSSAIAFTGQLEYFVGTSAGLFSTTGLPSVPAWFQEGPTTLGNSVVSNLDLRPSDNKLLVGTHGYGMWTASLGTMIPTPTATPTPLPPRNNGRIAFSSNNNAQNNREIYTMTATGDDLRRLTDNGVTDTAPSFSPDGSQIVYRSAGSLFKMNADGTGSPVQLTAGPNDENPSWSPEGSQIAFVREVMVGGENNLDIFVLASNGSSGPRNITNNAATDRDPVWSADGSLIVFTSDRDGDNEIYLVNNIDNSTVYRLTDNTEPDDNPAISPADGSLVYVGVRNGNSDIFNQAGVNLTNNPATDDNPGFSPDGQQIVFTRTEGDTEIFTMTKTGGSQTQRTFNTATDTTPDWGANGSGACTPAPAEMVSWFKGENNAADSHGANNGTAAGVAYVPARVGTGFKFDGVDDKVEIPDAPSLKPANVAVETWVRFDSLTSNTLGGAPNGYQYLVFKKNSRSVNFEGYALVKYPDNRLVFVVTDANGVTAAADSGTTVVTTGEFYHVVGQFDGTRARIYVNGNLVGTANTALTLNYDTRPVFLGTSGESNYDGKFNGVLDEVTIYNDDLSLNTITDLYNAGSAGKCPLNGCNPVSNGNVNWYRGQANANDSTGTNNGTVQGNVMFAPGRIGSGFRFDGGSVNVSRSITDDFSIEFWMKTEQPGGSDSQWYNGFGLVDAEVSGVTNDFGVSLAAGKVLFGTGNPDTTIKSAAGVNDNQWHHVVATRTKSSGAMKLYLDGTEVAAGTGTTASLNVPANVRLGGLQPNHSFYLGFLDEVKLYNRALSLTEVQTAFANDCGGGPTPTPTPPPPTPTPTPTVTTVTYSGMGAGSCPNAPTAATIAPAVPGLTFSQFGRGSGVPCTTNSGGISGNGFDGNLATNTAASKWFVVDITSDASTNFTVDAMSIVTSVSQDASEAIDVQYSINGGIKTSIGSISPTNGATPYPIVPSSTISAGPNQMVSLFFIPYNLAAPATNARILNSTSFTVSTTPFTGSPTPTPTPTTTPTPTPACFPAPNNLVSWWKGEGNALDAVDGNHGTQEGGVSYQPGMVGQAFNLNGTNQRILIGNPANMQLQDFTIDLWVQRASTTVVSNNPAGPSQLAAFLSYGTNGYGFGIQPDGTILLTKVGVSGTDSVGAKITDTSLHHVAVTKSGGNVTFYVDGVPSAGTDGPYDPGFTFSSNAYIGYFGSGGGDFLGKLDEVDLFSRSLNTAEIQGIYNAGANGKCPAGGTPTPTPTSVTYNASDEFSPTQNGTDRVWRYGYSASHADNAFTAFTQTRTDASCGGQFDAWLVPNNDRVPHISRHSLGLTCAGVPGNALFIHPGQTILGGGDPSRRAVVRWTAPVSGTFQLTGSLQRQNSSATTDLKIIKNAGASESVIYSASNVSTYQIAYNVTVPDVQQGDRLDFSVGDGGNGYNSDGSSIVINIGPPVTACSIAPANLQVFVPGENSPNDVQSNNAGTPVGNATYDTGKVGQALKFDGDGDYVTIADNAAQRPASQLTAEGWFKFDSLSGSLPHLVAKPRRDNNLDSYVLWYDAGNIRIGYTDTDGDFIFHNTGFVPQTGVFNHYAMVLNTEDAGATANTFKLLLNGAEIFSGAADKAILYDANPFPLVIGADLETNTPSFFLNGAADEVSIYNRALTQTEIFNIVRQGSFGKCSGTAACYPAPSGIVSWWKGDGTANDSAGPNNGTLQNGATYATGISGQAFSFNGSNQYMLAGDPIPASLQIQNEISLESWIYVTSYPGDLGVILGSQRDSGINSGATLMLDGRTNPDGQTAPPGHIHFQIGDGSFHVTNANAQVPLNQWVHVLATRRANEDGKIYYNGVLQPSTSAPWNGTISYSGSWFAIGQQKDLNRPFNGLIDESAIYNRALTATEVAGIYAAGSAGMCPIPTPTPTPTGAPAAAGVLNGTISAGQTLTGVTVTYTDNTAINVSTIDHNDIVVTGPNGFNAPASLQSLDNNTNGTPRVAGYLLGSPGGSWDIGDNGTYSIVMNANQVSDTDGAFVAAGVIGTFVVDLNPPPTPTPTNTPTATPTNTPTATPTNTPTATPTSTPTATPTNTPTATPTATPTSTPTATPTNTPTATPTATPTSTPTATPTATPTPSAPTPIILAGADSGQSEICTFDPDGEPRMCFTPFGSTYTGGIRVATGDVNGDGTSDIIAGRATGASHLKVYDGRTSAIIWDFFAFGSHTFGINVASGDVDGDGQDDVIVGPGTGGTPLLHIYSGANGQNVRGFFAYPSTFTGGVRVAAGDLDGDGRSDIITGPGPGGPDVVKVFSGFNGTEIDNFSPFAGFTGGLFVGAGHVNTDGIADVIVGADEGLARAPVRVFNGADLTMIHSILTQVGGTTGVRVGSQDINSDGRDDIVTGSGPGTPGVVKVYDAVDASMIAGFVVYNQRPGGDSPQLGEFQGGISIAAGSISNAAPTPLPTTLSITGVVRQYSESGAFSPQAGATVTLTGTFGASTVTDTAGRYTFQNLPIGGGYTVLTTGLNRSYEPNSHSYSALTASVFNADFVAFAAEIPRQARLESSHTAPGSPVAVPVLISSLGNEKAVDFSVNYDLNPLSSPTVACGTDATGCAIITDTSIPGTLGVRMTLASSPISGDREIARITFQTVATSATNSDITFTDTPTARSIRDSEGNVLSTTYQNGLIVFSQGYEGDLSPRPSGDGAITATDVVLTRSLVAGLTSPNSAFNERQRADTSPAATRGDDQLDATDIVQTRRYSTGLDPVQSAGGPAVGTVGVESNAGPAGGARRVRIVRLSETAKGKLQISIEIDGQGNESAASFTLRYDPAMVMRPIVTASSGNLAAADAGDGRLGIAIDSTEALKGEIITIAFDMADSTDLSKIDFGFDNSLAVSAISNFTGQRLPVLFEPLHTSRLKE